MRTDKFALVCALLVLSILEPITARRGFSGRGGSHSYPHSGGLSGSGGRHSYPSSGGISGGGSHGYPASGGLSGGGSHGYPSSGGHSGGSHSYPSSGGSHGYPSSGGSHGYPSSGGLSGSGSSNKHPTNTHGYPSGSGLSGNTAGSRGSTNVHHHYHYNPPKEIRYTPAHGGAPVSYPVYHGSPPTYVYKYKDSGSKYGTLLAGLALLNLGALAAGTAAYAAASHNNGNSHYSNYKPQPGEYCKFGVKKDNGDYEETKIDCQLITSFILQADQGQTHSGGANKTTVTTSVTNVTTVNITNGLAPEHPPMNTTMVGDKLYQIMSDGTLVPVNTTALNATSNANGMTSVVTTVTNTTTVTDALDVKGQPIAVTPGMQCFVIRHTPVNQMRKTVPCGLLQSYAEQSLKRNSAVRSTPAFTVLAVVLAAFVVL